MKQRILAGLLMLTCYLPQLFAQNLSITYDNPSATEPLVVCDSAAFQITLTNTSNVDVTNPLLTVQFPSGVTYLPGSSNMVESDLSDLSAPVFSIPDLNPDQMQIISLFAKADCSLVAAINNMQLFSNNIFTTYDGGGNTETTIPYNIETPLLVMANTGMLIQSGTQGDILTRSFTITNTRLGSLRSFTFKDTNNGGIAITSVLGTDISTQDNIFELLLDGNDFMTIGDGDEFFELDEIITITEEIEIISCGSPIPSVNSNINTTWGCDSDVCESTSSIEGFIGLEIAYLEPELTFTPVVDDIPECYCSGEPIQHGLVISNNSIHDATSIKIALSEIYKFGGIDTSSFTVDSVGFITPIMNIAADTVYGFDSLCNITIPVYKDALLTLPILEAGESFTLYWDVYVCALECGGLKNSSWSYIYNYFGICPPVPKISGIDTVFNEEPILSSNLINTNPDTLLDGSITTFQYTLISDELLNSSEELTITFEIPCGFNWLPDNEIIFDGQAPNSYNISNTIPYTIVSATYAPPFSSNSITLFFDLELICADICPELLCNDTLITSCLNYCERDPPDGLNISVNSSLQIIENCPSYCNLNACSSNSPIISCEIPSCEQYIPGYADYTFSVFRTNYGLPDNNDDRLADTNGTIDLNLIRRDRVIAGDTVEVNVKSIVIIDEPGYSFPAGQILINLNSPDIAINNLELLMEGGLLPIHQELIIYDNSNDIYYDCGLNMPLDINFLEVEQSFSFQFDISPNVLNNNACNIPIGFEYEIGDSILFKQQFRIMHNLVPPSGGSTPAIATLHINPELYLLEENSSEPDEEGFNCGCETVEMELSGYRYNIISGIHAVPDCDTSIFVGGALFSFLLGSGNFFPYEHRSLGQLTDWRIILPDEFSIVESKMTSLELQDNVILFNNSPLLPFASANSYEYDLLPFQTPTLDEGFTMLIQSRFLANCTSFGSYPLTIRARIEPAPNLIYPSVIDEVSTKQAALRMLNPRLELEANFFNTISYADKAAWDFSITNNMTTIASFVSGAAQNVWLRPSSLNGQISDFELIDANTGISVPSINGIFQLGVLDALGVVDLQLSATNTGCDEEVVRIDYGWNCEVYNNPITTPCNRRSDFFTAFSPVAAIEQSVESPPGPHLLCDTIDYHTVTVFSADLGNAYNPTIEIQLPQGVYILSGSSEIAYPTDNDFLPVGDPTDTGTGTLVWNISDLQDSIGQHGLPGFIFAPVHRFQIRFKLFTDCAFIAGSYPILFANAEEICGTPTNFLAEAAAPILLDGLPPPYNASISGFNGIPTISCQDSIPIEISITADASTINGDSIFITLPSGINYVSGSIIGNANTLIQEPNISFNNNLQKLKWPLMPGVNPGAEINFEIMLEGFSELDCGPVILLMQTVGPASALCTADNSFCDILVETGSNLIPLNIDRPSYAISGFGVTVEPSGNTDIINFNLLITNNGFLSQPPILLDFYLDTDNSGTWTAADSYVTEVIDNNVIANGNGATVLGSFTLDSGQVCDLIVVINKDKHCACAGDEQVLNTTITYLVPDEVSLCSGESQSIGIAETTGATYQWIPQAGITCINCPTSDLELTNDSLDINTLTYTLIEDDGDGCITAYEFTVNLQPQLGINNSTTTLCLGDSVLLEATSAASYSWIGSGITEPGNQNQLVTPQTTSTYTVQLTDNVGCSDTESILVTVINPPVAFAGNDTLLCENSIVQLHAFFDPSYTYQWAPASFLSNANSSSPVITNNTTTTYSLTVTNTTGCQNTDQIIVDFRAAPTLTGAVNSFICFGDSVLLRFNGALNYSWSPALGLSCTSCPETYAFPSASTTYALTGSDAIGCSDTVFVMVNVQGGSAVSENLSLCEGESLMIGGQFISTPGVYCDTMVSQFTSCDSIHCFDVEELLEINTEEVLMICEGESIVINGVTYSTSGTYCDVLQTFAGCDSTHCVDLEVREKPVIDILPEVSIQLGDTLALGPFPDGYFYEWSPSAGLSCTDCANPLAFPLEDTEYLVLVSDSIGCNNEFTIQTRTTIPICLPPHVFMPNAFTPNGDNENDVLRVYGNSIERLHLVIFNRWGEKVFETSETDGFWDGTFKGKRLEPDVFGYFLEVDCIGGETFEDRGNVTLLK